MNKKYIQLGESSSYWNVVEVDDVPPNWARRQMEPGEICGTPVCRVHKHSEGRANLAKILALPDLLAACKHMVESVAAEYSWRTVEANFPDAIAAIAKAEGQS